MPLDALPPEIAADLHPARDLVWNAWRRGLAPDPERTVDQWADAERRLAPESGTPFPGPWVTDRVPYLREIMRCMSLSHPSRRVTLAKSAQTGGSECGVNLEGQIMAETPCPVLTMLPSFDEAKDYNRLKLQPMIDVTPAVKAKVRDVISRDEQGSTVNFKRFPGGYLQLVGANSSKNLQMRSARVLINEEISEFPWDVDGRGDPLALAEVRLTAFKGREKIVDISTPGVEGSCRVTTLYQSSSRGRYRVPCPHCGEKQVLLFAHLRYSADDPSNAAYHCQACGAAIEQHHKPGMIAAGEWHHDRPELVDSHVGFHINALYSPFLSWADVARAYVKARAEGTMKVFTQQMLGEAFREQGEAPDAEQLHRMREVRPLKRLPPGALWITGAADVQGDRIEWDVIAWGVGLTAWVIDTGIILGAPTDDATWSELRAVTGRRYPDGLGRTWPIDAFGVDTGYSSHEVYRFVATHPRAEATFALDGRGDPMLPPLGTPKAVDVDWNGRKIGKVLLWPVGTHALKLEHYAAVRRTILGRVADGDFQRGAFRLPEVVDLDYCRQCTSEFLATVQNRGGHEKREWRVIAGVRNERLDTAVYNRALAHHLTDALTPEQWQALAASRATDPAAAQQDLAAYWTERFGTDAAPARPAAPEPAQELAAAEEGRPGAGWIDDDHNDWFNGDD